MTLKELRDDLSRKMAADKSLADVELNHVLIETVDNDQLVDYMLRDDSDVEEDDEDDYDYDDEDDSELDDDDDDDGEWW